MVSAGADTGRRLRRSMATRKSTPLPTSLALQPTSTTVGSGGMRVARGVVKTLSVAVGGSVTFVALMATIGLVVDSGWIRSIGAALVMLAIPALLVDRLLPENVTPKTRGLPTDVFALVWLASALLYAALLHDLTRNASLTEGDRLSQAGYPRLAKIAYLVAGVTATAEPRAQPASLAIEPSVSSARSAHATAPSASAHRPAPAAASATSAAPATSAPLGAASKPLPDKDAATLFEELAPAVVTVAVGDEEHVRGGGTGFLIDKHGTIATNQHVVNGAKRVRVTFMQGAVFEAPELLIEDASVDLALLRVTLAKPDAGDPVAVAPTELGDSEAIVVGERAISIGNPLGLDHTLTDGLISARRVYEGRHWIQTSVPISPGNSGGPLFNLKGQVIGVTTASLGDIFGRAQNLNLAVPANILKQLLKDKYPAKRRFGDAKRSSHW